MIAIQIRYQEHNESAANAYKLRMRVHFRIITLIIAHAQKNQNKKKVMKYVSVNLIKWKRLYFWKHKIQPH